MFRNSKKRNRLTVISSILILLLSNALGSRILADPPRMLIHNAAFMLTMDTNLGQGDLGILEGARVLDMSSQIGSLTPGKKADLIVLDPGDV